MIFPRESGILLHISSLPGPYGIGDLGPEAYQFVDTLESMGQKLWQVLPTGDTGYGYSPYTTASAFANNPLFINFDLLIEQGLIDSHQLESYPDFSTDKVKYQDVVPVKLEFLDIVCKSFHERASEELKRAFHRFCEKEAYWLDDYICFIALKEAHGGQAWNTWNTEVKDRKPEALKKALVKYSPSMDRLKILQFLFDDQWHRLKAYAKEKGVKIIGDIPIYVSLDSADVWVNPELFQLDEQGEMIVQSGCPPDYFQQTGQLWGNPVYNWAAHEKSEFHWWIHRIGKLLDMVDIIRIDHFNGLAKYWEIGGQDQTAENGKWTNGPGDKLLKAVTDAFGEVPIIAEDLGEAAQEGAVLREKYELPGMKILQFSFNPLGQSNGGLPESYPENCVVYTGTHDNDTIVGWFNTLGNSADLSRGRIEALHGIRNERAQILDYLRSDGNDIQWELIEVALNSKANTVIIPLQDILGLGSESRMNIPGTIDGNWTWRFEKESLSPKMIHRMLSLTKATHRIE